MNVKQLRRETEFYFTFAAYIITLTKALKTVARVTYYKRQKL